MFFIYYRRKKNPGSLQSVSTKGLYNGFPCQATQKICLLFDILNIATNEVSLLTFEEGIRLSSFSMSATYCNPYVLVRLKKKKKWNLLNSLALISSANTFRVRKKWECSIPCSNQSAGTNLSTGFHSFSILFDWILLIWFLHQSEGLKWSNSTRGSQFQILSSHTVAWKSCVCQVQYRQGVSFCVEDPAV